MAMLMGVRHVLRGGDEGRWEDFKRDGRAHVRSSDEMSPLAVGIIAVWDASFVSIFVLGVVMSFNPLLIAAVLTWEAVIATGAVFARRQRAKPASRESTGAC